MRQAGFEQITDQGLKVNELWDEMYKIITVILDKLAPMRVSTFRKSRPEWLTAKIMEMMKDRDSLFVCGISLTSGQLISELFPDCTRSCFLQVVLRRRGGDRIYEMRCLLVAVGTNARFIVLPHWDNMS